MPSSKKKSSEFAHFGTGQPESTIHPGSTLLRISPEWRISVRKHTSRSDEDSWSHIDLNEYWLPASPLNAKPMPFVKSEDACEVVCLALDRLLTAEAPSKSTHLVARARAATIVKFLEYSWLNGIFRVAEFPESMWSDLQEKFNAGGWAEALRIKERAIRVLEELPLYGRGDLWEIGKRNSISITRRFYGSVGTNLSYMEMSELRALLATKGCVSGQVTAKRKAMSFSTIARFNTEVGSLADLPGGKGLTSVPTENPYLYAQQHGTPLSRTKSITPEAAACLLVESFRWIHDYGPPIVAMLHALKAGLPVQETSQTERSRRCLRFLDESPEVKKVSDLLGVKVAYIEKSGWAENTSISVVTKSLLTACFHVIAAMNGRRKDELIGRAIGLHAGSLKVLSAKLGLYECSFYVEKTVHDFVPFQVNEMTTEALTVLAQVSQIAWDAHDAFTGKETMTTERKLFVFPTFAARDGACRVFFRYEKANTKYVTQTAHGEIKVSAHMFRRLYALIFNYRYENASLLALSRQLRHLDLGMTAHYVLEPGSRQMVNRAELHWPISKEAMVANQIAHATDLSKEVEVVSKEKMHSVVQRILTDSQEFSGGFPKLVSKLHKKLGGRLSYVGLGRTQQAQKITKLLLDRGHRPVAFPHGDCNAGAPKRSARCYSQEDASLQRSRASASTCATCAYHRVSRTHLLTLENEAETMERELANGAHCTTVRKIRLERELVGLQRALHLHRTRLSANNSQQAASHG